MNWLNEVEKRKNDLIKDTQDLLRIKSVLNEDESKEGAPFGNGIKEALEFTLNKCRELGLEAKNFDGYAGHAEIGQGDDIVGVLCHLDVVPEGDGWTFDPYGAVIEDGKLYARGALDDKGPTMAAIYALKIIQDLDLKLSKRVRVIFGTNEESGSSDLDYYFQKEEMPLIGFAPDADFPIIITEKGIVNISIKGNIKDSVNNKANIISFSAGRRFNMVPDHAIARIGGNLKELESIKKEFDLFLKEYQYGGGSEISDNFLILSLNGLSAHGMEPFKGINAGLELNHFLISLDKWLNISDWMKWVDKALFHDYYGENLRIDYKDDISGVLTVNPGILTMENGELLIKLNIRYPVTTDYEKMQKIIDQSLSEINLFTEYYNVPPHHVDSEHFLVKTLKKVYEEQTGEEAKLLAIGGGTYARSLKTGVAFGPLFPGKKETAHQRNEYLEIDDLIKATAIYTQAIYELAK